MTSSAAPLPGSMPLPPSAATDPTRLLMDADILIDLERGRPAAIAWFTSLPSAPAAAGFAAMELLEGAANALELHQIEHFLGPLPLRWPTEADLLRAMRVYQPTPGAWHRADRLRHRR